MSDDGFKESEAKLRSFFNAMRALDEERQDLTAQIKEIRDQAKEAGFDATTLTKMVIRARKMPIELLTADGILETYEAALGINAAAAGMLSTRQRADGSFEIEMVPSAASPAAKRLSRKQEQLRDQIALAQASAMARSR